MTALDHLLPLVGDSVVDRYELLAEINRGASGIVYTARQRGLDEPVVVKILLPHVLSNDDMVRRFIREAELVKRLHHPNTIRILDVGRTEDGLPFYVMEYIPGRSLKQILEEEDRLSPARTRRIALQVLGSLSEAHSVGIIHRDLKPSNLLLYDVPGTRDFVKLVDFGVAKLKSETAPGRSTVTGVVVGTPAYMSPEQARGSRNVDGRSDLYTVGLLMAECLSGYRAIDADTLFDVIALYTQPEAPDLADDLPHSPLVPLIRKATRALPQERFQTADEMAAVLESIGPLPEEIGPHKMARRRRLPERTPATLPAVFHFDRRPSSGLLARLRRSARARGLTLRSPLGAVLALGVPTAVVIALLWPSSGSNAGRSHSLAAAVEMSEGSGTGAASGLTATERTTAPGAETESLRDALSRSMAELHTALPTLHTVHIDGTPGATVRVGDRALGSIPFDLTHPALPTEVVLEVSRRGYLTQTVALSLEEDLQVVVLEGRNPSSNRTPDSERPDAARSESIGRRLPFGEMEIYTTPQGD